MTMVELGNCWDGIEDFDNILNILDFPLESLEDDGFVADWDITNSHYLRPMQPNEVIGPPTAASPKVDSWLSTHLLTGLVAPIDGAQEQKHQPNLIPILSAHHALQPNKLAEAQESSTFYTQSPVSVLKSSGSYSASIPIPRRARSRRPKQIGRNPWLSVSSRFISSSKWASIPLKDEIEKKSLDEGEKSMPWAPPSWPTPIAKKCMHCEVTKTPQWREGPLGPKTLCNACGVRYRSGRLFPEYRPTASPTFVPTLHSNSHKKVIEMRRS